jgi:DNA-binding GntR family transcriptional regulator
VLLQRSGHADPAEIVGPLRRTCCASQRLETQYDLPLVEAEYRLEAVAAQPVVAEALGVETRNPLFLIERTSY